MGIQLNRIWEKPLGLRQQRINWRLAGVVNWLSIPFLLFAHHSVSQESGIPSRVPWTSSKFVGSPVPALPYRTVRAFPGLKFNRCIDMAQPTGSNRIFLAEQGGKIFSFPDAGKSEKADLLVDLKKEIKGLTNVYALTFHPEFQKNRFLFVCYVMDPGKEDGTHISRFRVSESVPPTIDINSEKTILTFLSGGHNGCCLKFGPDGYLYISTGDGAGPNPPDPLKSGQDISNVLSSILRIDVNNSDGKNNYLIPDDNPFRGYKNARGEIWAYGFRNPWRMSFDKKTGDLWVGDVGWELWELMDRVERGGNYGWSIMEGNQPTNPGWDRGPTPILPPTIEHSHDESSSITDGLTYYGSRHKSLQGYHLYGDYDTGKLWGFRYENKKVLDLHEIADTTHRIVGFGELGNGEFVFLDHVGGTLHELVPNPKAGQTNPKFPRKLSQTGLFTSTPNHDPAPGVIRYSINAEPWENHAFAERLIAVPNHESIKPTGSNWLFPKGTVIAKSLSLELIEGDPHSRKRIETQVMHFDGDQWQTYCYRWNDEQSDAELVDASGEQFNITVKIKSGFDGKWKNRVQNWKFASRSECQRCHNRWSGPILGFNSQQLNKMHQYPDSLVPQLPRLAHLKIMDSKIDSKVKLANPYDPSCTLDDRARAYLDVNCAHCHRMHAGGSVLSKMHFDLPLEKTDMLGQLPSQGGFGMQAARVIAPGDPYRSVLLYRISKLGGGRMPHIGSSEVDLQGIDLIHDWIRSLPVNLEQNQSGVATALKTRSGESRNLDQLLAAKQGKTISQQVDKLLSSTGGAMMMLQALMKNKFSQATRSSIIGRATVHPDIKIRDLYESFLPLENRARRLGDVINPEKILSLKGNRERGRKIFFELETVQCKNCHQIGTQGKNMGPDLSRIGKKYSPTQILESILEPSRVIDPRYTTFAIETTEGEILSGLLVSKNGKQLVLKDINGNQIRIPVEKIERSGPLRASIMPELLLRDMTAQQAADLVVYLSSLKN